MAQVVVTEDYYSILQIPQSATLSTIREAYKKRALRFHPDKNKDANATSDFQKLSIAWETLKDPTTRAEYDRNYVKCMKRKFEEEEEQEADEDITRLWRERRDEMNREASAQWAHHAQFSNNAGAQHSPSTASKIQQVREWKRAVREGHLARLDSWMSFRRRSIVSVQDCFICIQKQRADIEKFAKDDEAIAKFRMSGSENPGFLEAIEKMIQARRAFASKLSLDLRSKETQLQILLREAGDDWQRYESEEASARKEQAKEALEMLGPRELNPPLFSMIDTRGQMINHWKALSRVKVGTRFSSIIASYREGPWHMEGDWERLVGEYTCGRCGQNAFQIVLSCSPAKCPGCGLVVCNDCYRDLRLLREYADWIMCKEGEMTESLFSLVFDLCGKPFRASWENDPKFESTFEMSHL